MQTIDISVAVVKLQNRWAGVFAWNKERFIEWSLYSAGTHHRTQTNSIFYIWWHVFFIAFYHDLYHLSHQSFDAPFAIFEQNSIEWFRCRRKGSSFNIYRIDWFESCRDFVSYFSRNKTLYEKTNGNGKNFLVRKQDHWKMVPISSSSSRKKTFEANWWKSFRRWQCECDHLELNWTETNRGISNKK